MIAPSSLYWKMGDALSAMLNRQGVTLANACLEAYRKIPIKMIDIDLKPALALELATAGKLRVYAYDD